MDQNGENMRTRNIALITELYGSKNCGGILQAFALQRFLESKGFVCEQLLIDGGEIVSKKTRFLDLIRLSYEERASLIKDKIDCWINPDYSEKRRNIENSINSERMNAGKEFIDKIRRSTIIYTPDTIGQANDKYDIFICGSDQIWNPHWVTEPLFESFFLGFVGKKKVKISYAASIGVQNVTRAYIQKIKPLLDTMDAISVREESACSLLQPLTEKKVKAVLDPSLLFTQGEWCELVNARIIDNEFLFCYLLGRERRKRIITKKIAEGLGRVIKMLPHATGRFCQYDEHFADYEYPALSPDLFVREIAAASYVITDSFHCIVFSILMNKQFIVLKRNEDAGVGSTNVRLYDLLHIFGLEDRIVSNESEGISRLSVVIDYHKINRILEKKRDDSITWLLNSLSC